MNWKNKLNKEAMIVIRHFKQKYTQLTNKIHKTFTHNIPKVPLVMHQK
jgi:uncharacterized protein involved in tolerance to divalent cations